MKPMLSERPLRSIEAPACRWNPTSPITRCTREAVPELTPLSPLTTRETVLIETLARRATSAMVGRPVPSTTGAPSEGTRASRGSLPPAGTAPCDNVGTRLTIGTAGRIVKREPVKGRHSSRFSAPSSRLGPSHDDLTAGDR